jgi:hypothetical protein
LGLFLPIESILTRLSARSANGSVDLSAKMGAFLKSERFTALISSYNIQGLKMASVNLF